jgi:branched-chain amino acid transport system ATP-binding protein
MAAGIDRDDKGGAATGSMRATAPTREQLARLTRGELHLELRGLTVGYGKMEVVRGVDLLLGRGQSLCLVGPNGAGKSTLLHGVFGLADVLGGTIHVAGRDIRGAAVGAIMREARVSYVLQNSSIFPDMTVEENLLLGGYLLPGRREAVAATERIFARHPRLAARRREPAGALSGGERRILELSRALMTEPELLLVDEPSIGLEPSAVEAVFSLLHHLQRDEGRTIVIVEQNVKNGLEFADLGYVLVSGRVALAAPAGELLHDPRVGRLFLGGG